MRRPRQKWEEQLADEAVGNEVFLRQDFEEQFELQERAYNIRMQAALDEQNGEFAAERGQLLVQLRDCNAGRQITEQDYASQMHALATDLAVAQKTLDGVARGLKAGAWMFGIKIAKRHDLVEQASSLATWAMLHVSRCYREPIEKLCGKSDVKLDAWPAIDDAEHYKQLDAVLKKAFKEVKLQYRVKQALLYQTLETAEKSDELIDMQAQRIQTLWDLHTAERQQCLKFEQVLNDIMDLQQ
ncbi:hypothetical protein N0V86_003181 [Didymella sp. IMI 355093]|nr:hypothetical protein N0V86_003181 [Didymella sp. IMI 355093]